MAFTKDTASAAGRQGGRTTFARYGREHIAEIGRLGFDALARSFGFVGGGRRRALARLLGRGRLRDLGGDHAAAGAWARRVLDDLDPDAPAVPY